MKLPTRDPNLRLRKERLKRRREPKPSVVVYLPKARKLPPPLPATPLPPPDETDVVRIASVIDLEAHHCRWPIGEPTQGFCGCKPYPGLVYCEPHARRAYVPATAKRRPNPLPSKVPAIGITMFKNAAELLDA